jgi:Domain of unknown function (DUF4349)
MQTLKVFLLTLSILALAGCESSRDAGKATRESAPQNGDVAANKAPAAQPPEARTDSTNGLAGQLQMEQVSLKSADQSQTVADAMDRKIIKDADLTLEVDSPLESQRKVTSIAESHGGFVVTSESKQRQSSVPAERVMDVTLVIRVPSTQFGPTKDAILALSNHVTQSKETGQDVTEEFMDLEARIKTQKALEAQFLEIMKQAHKVEDALEVQRQIADVRTGIEKLEGRKRFLENRSSLSTITVNLQSPTNIIVSASGFGRDVKEAFRDSVDMAKAIVLFLIRFVIVMLPVFLLIILPIGLVTRYLLRRARRLKLARGTAETTPVAAT